MSKEEMQAWRVECDRIIREEDYDAIFAVEDDQEFGYLLTMVLLYQQGEIPFETRPHSHRVLVLCMTLEANAQADTIMNFFQEEYAARGREAVDALAEIGGTAYAKAFEAVCDMLPEEVAEGGQSGMDKLEEVWEHLPWEQIDPYVTMFADYEEGYFPTLYRAYAQHHREDFLSGTPTEDQ